MSEARATLAAGSSSFAAAARLLPAELREDVARLYAWCRHCDDRIDGQCMGQGADEVADARAELAALRRLTARACAGQSTGDAVFDALGGVVARHCLPAAWLQTHLDGFAMDVDRRRYADLDDLLVYCHGVAGVVGLMMARLMGVRDPAVLQRACDLGLAFQLTNIARDVLDDAAIGRIYLPLEWLAERGVPTDPARLPAHRAALAPVTARLLASAEPYYDSARAGLAHLPARAAWAIGAALRIYRDIGLGVQARGARAWDRRVSTPPARKLLRVAQAGGGTLLRARLAGAPRPALWRAPDLDAAGRP